MVKAARVGAVSAALWMGGWAEAVREPRKNALTCQSARKSLTSPTVADFIALLATLSRLYALRVAPSAVDTSAHCDEGTQHRRLHPSMMAHPLRPLACAILALVALVPMTLEARIRMRIRTRAIARLSDGDF